MACHQKNLDHYLTAFPSQIAKQALRQQRIAQSYRRAKFHLTGTNYELS